MKLKDLFNAQALVESAANSLATNTTDSTLKLAVANFVAERQSAEEVAIDLVDLLKNYKGIAEETVRVFNRYYSRFRAEYSMENLAWSPNRILQRFEEPLRNNILEGIVGISPMESGGPLIFKLMLEIIMDADDSALRVLTKSLQTLQLKDVPGKNICTAVSYLKGALMLLQNCSELRTDTMGLLNGIMISADCDEFSGFMNLVYYDHKRKTRLINHSEYLRLTEAEYRTFYWKKRWTASVNDPGSVLFIRDTDTQGSCIPGGHGGGRFGGRGDRGEESRGNRWGKLSCHNCSKKGHIVHNYWAKGGVTHGEGDDDVDTNNATTEFPGVYDQALRHPPREISL